MIGEAAALAASLCWAGGSHLFRRVGSGNQVPAGALNLGKCATATALFAVTGLLLEGRAFPAVDRETLGWLVASGVVGLSVGDACYFGAMFSIGVRRALLLLSTAPVFAAIGGALFLGERLGAREMAAIGAVMAGVMLVVYEPPPEGAPAGRGGAMGPLLGLASGICQAAGSLLSRFAMARGTPPLSAAMVRLPAGLVGIMVLAAVTGRLVPWTRSLAKPGVGLKVAGSSVVGTYAGIWLSQIAIGRSSSTAVASTLLATSPLFALPLGRWLEGEKITLRAAVGTALATAGLVGLTLGAGSS